MVQDKFDVSSNFIEQNKQTKRRIIVLNKADRLNDYCRRLRVAQGYSVLTLLGYGMAASLGLFDFNAYVFGLLLALNLILFISVHLMVRKVSTLIKNDERKLAQLDWEKP